MGDGYTADPVADGLRKFGVWLRSWSDYLLEQAELVATGQATIDDLPLPPLRTDDGSPLPGGPPEHWLELAHSQGPPAHWLALFATQEPPDAAEPPDAPGTPDTSQPLATPDSLDTPEAPGAPDAGEVVAAADRPSSEHGRALLFAAATTPDAATETESLGTGARPPQPVFTNASSSSADPLQAVSTVGDTARRQATVETVRSADPRPSHSEPAGAQPQVPDRTGAPPIQRQIADQPRSHGPDQPAASIRAVVATGDRPSAPPEPALDSRREAEPAWSDLVEPAPYTRETVPTTAVPHHRTPQASRPSLEPVNAASAARTGDTASAAPPSLRAASPLRVQSVQRQRTTRESPAPARSGANPGMPTAPGQSPSPMSASPAAPPARQATQPTAVFQDVASPTTPSHPQPAPAPDVMQQPALRQPQSTQPETPPTAVARTEPPPVKWTTAKPVWPALPDPLPVVERPQPQLQDRSARLRRLAREQQGESWTA